MGLQEGWTGVSGGIFGVVWLYNRFVIHDDAPFAIGNRMLSVASVYKYFLLLSRIFLAISGEGPANLLTRFYYLELHIAHEHYLFHCG
jgi:hypothetical protein